MFVDAYGTLGAEHARDIRRSTAVLRPGRPARAHRVRDFVARGHLGPVDNYRVH